jgi:hypothetical protein
MMLIEILMTSIDVYGTTVILYTVRKSENWCKHFESRLALPATIELMCTLWHNKFTPSSSP